MGALRQHTRMSLDEFLAWEERQPTRHEFIHGRIVAMNGGTVAHNQIIANIDRKLAHHLRGTPCRVFRESLKLLADESIFYPDVFVTCARLNDQDRVATEPTVIVEVLSGSTTNRDRLVKSTAYRSLPSLAQYILVSQDVTAVESMRRDGTGWLHEVVTGRTGLLRIPTLDFETPLSVFYEDTDIPDLDRFDDEDASARQ